MLFGPLRTGFDAGPKGPALSMNGIGTTRTMGGAIFSCEASGLLEVDDSGQDHPF
jgi:hypothetical protein